jgi:4-amino-4-deoxy-L-arabinose transferase-like glycosyltransferase
MTIRLRLDRDGGSHAVLLVIVLVGFALRLVWMLTETPVISMEGSEYVRMAENLAQGHGLIGNFEGPETMYTPLFSVLTAGMMPLARSGEAAAHLVALLFGTALIAVVFAIARFMYGERTAHLCAALVAVHPLLVKLSASIYNEAVYVTLLVTAIYFGIRTLDLQSLRDALITGLCLGLAYLSRPEAFVYPIFFAIALCAAGVTYKRMRAAAVRSAVLVGAFCVLASPYVAFLYHHTGHFRMEGKWSMNYTIAQRLHMGMNFNQAAYGIDDDLTAAGPLLVPSKFADFTPFPHALSDKVGTMLTLANANKEMVYGELVAPWTGSPVLLALAILGLFRTWWSKRRVVQETVLLLIAASIVLLVLTATAISSRYFFPLVPLLVLWGGKGVEEIGQWGRGLAGQSTRLISQPIPIGVGLQVFAALLVIALAVHGTRHLREFVIEQADHSTTRDAGLWLRQYHPGPKRVAALLTVVPYYADATLVQFPFAHPDLTLRYLDMKHVDFVVLESQYATTIPTIGEWLAHGIPDDHARLIFDSANADGNRVLIYSWQERDAKANRRKSPDLSLNRTQLPRSGSNDRSMSACQKVYSTDAGCRADPPMGSNFQAADL